MLLNDGVSTEQVKTIGAEWEKRTRLNLEWDEYQKLVQKDVNNFIMIAPDGHYKSKGAYLKELSPIDSDLLISNKALIDYFVHGTSIEETVQSSTHLSDFQKIVKISSLYSHALHGDKPLKDKVLRVFASNKESDPGVFKVKKVDNAERIEKIGNTPDHCFLCGEDINDAPIPSNLDLNYYADLIQGRLNDFYSAERKAKVKPKSEIKGINEETYNRILDLDFDSFDTFTDLLAHLKENDICNKTVVRILIELDMLSKFGKAKKLIDIWDAFYNEIKYSNNQSEKKREEKLEAIHSIEDEAANVDLSEREKVHFRQKYLGSFVTNKDEDRRTLLIKDVGEVMTKKDKKQFGYYIIAKSVGSGKESRYTILNRSWRKNGSVEAGDVIRCVEYKNDGQFFNLVEYFKM